MSQIRCPNCGTPIDIDQTLYTKLEAAAKANLEHEIQEHRKKYKEALQALKAQEHHIAIQRSKLEEEAAKKVQQILKKEKKQLRQEIHEETKELIEGLKRQLANKNRQLKELHKAQLEIEKLKQEKLQIQERAQLEAKRQLNKELQKEKERLAKTISQKHLLKLKEKEKQLNDLKIRLEEVQRKVEQSSQQLQGEVQELAIEEWLTLRFPFDTIDAIKKGERGADCIQYVYTKELGQCGSIYYESKRTKEFNKEWIEKFKADIRKKGCDVGVLVTQTMPKGMERMGLLEGIWVCSFEEFKALSFILRHHIIHLAQSVKSQENKGDKMSMLYSYLTSNEFRMQIEAIVEGFTQMQEDLAKEKRAMAKIWKQREKQLEKVLQNTIDMYASIRGIAGKAIPPIKQLEFPYED